MLVGEGHFAEWAGVEDSDFVLTAEREDVHAHYVLCIKRHVVGNSSPF